MSHRWPDTFFSSLDCKNRIFIPLPSLVEHHLPCGCCSLLWRSFQMVGFWLSRINSYFSNLSLSLVAEHEVARAWCAHWRVWMERPAGVGSWGICLPPAVFLQLLCLCPRGTWAGSACLSSQPSPGTFKLFKVQSCHLNSFIYQLLSLSHLVLFSKLF